MYFIEMADISYVIARYFTIICIKKIRKLSKNEVPNNNNKQKGFT